MQAEKMKCPRCGADMNHHGDKVLRAESIEAISDPTFGGSIVELHSCPVCGSGASRDAK